MMTPLTLGTALRSTLTVDLSRGGEKIVSEADLNVLLGLLLHTTVISNLIRETRSELSNPKPKQVVKGANGLIN